MEGSGEPPRKRQRIEGPKVTVPGRGSQPQRQLPREAYTIGWICPLHVELSAALAMLDEEHVVPKQDVGDANTYMVGKIHQHSVVIACLPHLGYGTNNAATVANNMRRSFPSIRLQLVVGIGGGVPGKADVRLGDVVVGQKVLQHDIGKLKDGILQVMGAPVEAPPEAMSAITMMQASHRRHSRSMLTALSEVAGQNPNITSDADKSQLQDWLYESSYEHVESGSTCDACDSSRRIFRPRRPDNNPVIHYGTIASGNQVLKHARTRDRLCQTHDVLCVEMEAAGLIRNSPSLVIRGVCDYADSHKNKEWQPYAAVVAAAYAREFLYFLPAREARTQPGTSSVLNLGEGRMTKTHVTNDSYLEVVHLQRDMPHCSQTSEPKLQYPGCNTTFTDKELQALVDSLKFDELGNRHGNVRKAHGRTCKWLLHKQEYRDWLNPNELSNHHGLLWIKGKPGAGKSTLMKFTLGEVKKRMDNSIIISFFFNARGNGIEKSTSGMYRSLLFQLLTLMPSLRHIFESLDVTAQSEHHPQWRIETLKELFQQAVQSLINARLLCLVDALDECDESEIRDMVSFFQDLGRLALSTSVHFHVCFASRHYPHITVSTGIQLTLEGQEGHSKDISNYIETNLQIGNNQAANMLRFNLLQKASGVFMWVVLVVKMLNEDHDSGLSSARLRRKLQDIPGDLHALFHNLLIRDSKMTEEMQLCFQWVLFARQPLSAKELYSAIHSGLVTATNSDGEELFGWQSDQMPLDLVERFILSASKGLVEITKSKPQITQFIHESVKDFLLKENELFVIWPNIGEGFEGRSHDRLKKCCLNYILIVHQHIFPQLIYNTARSALFLRHWDTEYKNWPFLHYAAMNLLHHADLTQGLGNNQHDFISRFPHQEWVCLYNIVEPNIDRHYGTQTSLLYILAEHNLMNLIHIHPSKDCFLSVEAEKRGTPLFAALALKNHEVAQGFLEIGTNSLDVSLGEYTYQRIPYKKSEGTFNRSHLFTFNSSRNILSQLAELGNDVLLSMALCQRSVKIDLSPCQKTGWTLLHQAACRGFVASLGLLIQEGASIDELSLCSNGLTALQLAARHGQEESVRLLLDKGASVGGCSRVTGRNALSWAVEGGPKIVQLLLEKNAEVNAADYDRRTPLMYAASRGADPSIISLLLEKGAMIYMTDYKGWTALHYAVNERILEATRLLLDKGAAVDPEDNDGNTPLIRAVRTKNIALMRLLIRGGASLRASSRGIVPLNEATKIGDKAIIEVLLEEGADVDVTDKGGCTPLIVAIHEQEEEVADLLLATGAPSNVAGGRGTTPLHEAAKIGNEGILKSLLEEGATVDVADKDGYTPLIIAIHKENKTTMDLLLSAGALVNAATKPWDTWSPHSSDSSARAITNPSSDQGVATPPTRTFPFAPLFEAVRCSSVTIVEFLLEAGASVDLTENNGNTPLHWAVRKCKIDVIPLLLEWGASTSAVDGNGCTPLTLATHALSNTPSSSEKDKIQSIITLLKAANDPGMVAAP